MNHPVHADDAAQVTTAFLDVVDPLPRDGSIDGIEGRTNDDRPVFLERHRDVIAHRGLTAVLLRQFVPDELSCLCLWGDEGTTELVWERLRHAVRNRRMEERIVKVDRVVQRNNRICFDIYCEVQVSGYVLKRIRQNSKRYDWHCRQHIGWRERAHLSPTQQPPSPLWESQGPAILDKLRMATYNVAGIRRKRYDVQHLFETERLHILCLQETLQRATDYQLRIKGTRSFEALGASKASERGLAILVKGTLTGQSVGHGSPNFQFVRIFGGHIVRPIIVANLYVPTRIGRRRVCHLFTAALNDVRRSFPFDPVLIGGDFNMPIEETQHFAASWIGESRVLPTRPNSLPSCT